MTATRVLVVDDEESLRHMLSLSLSKDGFHVWTAGSGKEGLETLKSGEPFDICVTDIRMPGMDGLAFIQDAMRLGDKAPTFIAMSAYGDKQLAVEALRRGAFDYISKPFSPEELSLKLRLVVERNELKKAPRAPRERAPESRGERRATSLEEIVMVSPPMQAIAKTVRRVATFPSTVLITGETGTGKERIASAIHAASKRASKPFVAVNCGAIPETLLESELFGYLKGAFTDASADRVGLFEQASGGTLFLDEIGELPTHLQVKLLRALVEGEIRPLGSTRPVAVDVRLIAATSRDLDQMVKDGGFREDLFHRLNVVPIHVPPLRDRTEDIRPLTEHFSHLLAGRFGVEDLEVGDDVILVLERYPWPGNVRELENALERAFVLSDGTGRLTAQDLDERFLPGERRGPSTGSAPTPSAGDDDELSLRIRLPEYEKQLIRRALERTGGNRSRAAVLLGISHRALLYKLKEYGIT
ncbi:MAG: sigma-54-dependent Fis family transcriptional regulator [Deltaproteobacteria bacterium]|nr:sigma-54-dependent Fis family transcriptional regulator [Deltaproteobacteria bacterium]